MTAPPDTITHLDLATHAWLSSAHVGTLTTRQVADLTGLTERQLDSWARELGVLPGRVGGTPGSGHRREWSDEQARMLVVLRRLADTRATIRALTTAARALVKDPPRGPDDRRWLLTTERAAKVVAYRDLPSAWTEGAWCVPLRAPDVG